MPGVSLGLWQNFGHDRPLETSRAIVRRAFDLGVTHFDLANNYGPPYGSAEENFGVLLRTDLAPYRDELIISTKAGYDMWPGPYGDRGSRKYLLASLDQSLGRMGLDYVDIFYSHRSDPDTPLEETLGALDTAVRQGKALYAGISSYSAARTREAAGILRRLGTPLLIHQPSYSMLNRWIEPDLLDVLGDEGVGCIVFSPLAQGMLTDKYLDGIPEGSRASRDGSLSPASITEQTVAKVRGAQRDRAAARPVARAARDRLGAPRRTRDLGPRRRELASSSWRRTSARSTTSTSARTSSRRSTATRPRATSTSGRPRAGSSYQRCFGSRCWSRGLRGMSRRPALPQPHRPICGRGASQKKRQAGLGSIDEMKSRNSEIPRAFTACPISAPTRTMSARNASRDPSGRLNVSTG